MPLGQTAEVFNLVPLQAALYKPANFGIGGDMTQQVLWRITEGKAIVVTEPAFAESPAVVVAIRAASRST